MYKVTVGDDAKWQECEMTEEELNKAVDSARQIKMLSTLGLSVADLRDFLQQERDKERAKSSNDGDEEATAAKKRKRKE